MITCDLGSNTLRVLEFDCKHKKRVLEFERVVRTAYDLDKTNKISDASIQRIFDALTEAQGIFDFANHSVFAVTTEAMRRANNAQKLVQAIKQKFGITFEIIDGLEEARLTILGIESGLDDASISKERYCMMDLGGASTEISFKKDGDILSKSFPFGILTTAQKYENLEAITQNVPQITACVRSFMDANHIKPHMYEKFVATAGTPTTVAAFIEAMPYASYDYKKINGKMLSLQDFTQTLQALLQMPNERREFWVGTNRADLVCTGILIIQEVMQMMNFTTCIVIDNGLREGLALLKCDELVI
ncbi:MAG: phosphatase [Sulfurospirillum sp.]|nr:phosphatase [Sulfurospirillum sp.]